MVAIQEIDEDLIFPSSDGKPMAENTEQYKWIVLINENLEVIYRENPDVFIAGDLLWYPDSSTSEISAAPDAMVVFGRPKGPRLSYKQWREENIPPQVVFEILSPSNKAKEMEKKLQFYEHYGVQEYYIYDPFKYKFTVMIREGNKLKNIKVNREWVSPHLGIKFQPNFRRDLTIYRPDGEKFVRQSETDAQLKIQRQQVKQERQRAEQSDLRAERLALEKEQERQRAEQERQRAERLALEKEQERQRAEQSDLRAEQERQRFEKLVQELRLRGIDPDNLLS